MVAVGVMVGVAVAGSGPDTGSVASRVGTDRAGDVGEASAVGEGPAVGEGGGVKVGSAVQVGIGVGVATGGCKATMIRLRTMLTAIRALRTKMTVWLRLRFCFLRLRLLTKLYLLEKAAQRWLSCRPLDCPGCMLPGLYHRWVSVQLTREAIQTRHSVLWIRLSLWYNHST
jgi:hypothetical protein